jgi:hypothetical protein
MQRVRQLDQDLNQLTVIASLLRNFTEIHSLEETLCDMITYACATQDAEDPETVKKAIPAW